MILLEAIYYLIGGIIALFLLILALPLILEALAYVAIVIVAILALAGVLIFGVVASIVKLFKIIFRKK